MLLTSFKYFDPTSAPGWNMLSKEQQQKGIFDAITASNEANILGAAFNTNRIPSKEELAVLSDFQKGQLDYAQKIGEESLNKTLRAKMFYDLPKNVASAFAGPQAVMIAGMSRAPGMYNEAMASVPRFNIQPGVAANYNFPQYFS